MIALDVYGYEANARSKANYSSMVNGNIMRHVPHGTHHEMPSVRSQICLKSNSVNRNIQEKAFSAERLVLDAPKSEMRNETPTLN